MEPDDRDKGGSTALWLVGDKQGARQGLGVIYAF